MFDRAARPFGEMPDVVIGPADLTAKLFIRDRATDAEPPRHIGTGGLEFPHEQNDAAGHALVARSEANQKRLDRGHRLTQYRVALAAEHTPRGSAHRGTLEAALTGSAELPGLLDPMSARRTMTKLHSAAPQNKAETAENLPISDNVHPGEPGCSLSSALPVQRIKVELNLPAAVFDALAEWAARLGTSVGTVIQTSATIAVSDHFRRHVPLAALCGGAHPSSCLLVCQLPVAHAYDHRIANVMWPHRAPCHVCGQHLALGWSPTVGGPRPYFPTHASGDGECPASHTVYAGPLT